MTDVLGYGDWAAIVLIVVVVMMKCTKLRKKQ